MFTDAIKMIFILLMYAYFYESSRKDYCVRKSLCNISDVESCISKGKLSVERF